MYVNCIICRKEKEMILGYCSISANAAALVYKLNTCSAVLLASNRAISACNNVVLHLNDLEEANGAITCNV